MEIRLDNLDSEPVIELLAEHMRSMQAQSPPGSVHALDLGELKTSDISFWAAWSASDLMGCGALKDLGNGHGELKSMRTHQSHLRKGVAEKLLLHIVSYAKEHNYHRLSLETGSLVGFEAARFLYAKHGFTECEPFSDYRLDPHSMFMTLVI